MSGFVYCVKLKNTNFVKIGKSKDFSSRCQKFGVVESVIHFRHNHYELMEGLFHNAFANYRMPRSLINVGVDGATEYFAPVCYQKFKNLCEELNIKYSSSLFETGERKPKKKFEDCPDILVDSYINGYREAVLENCSFDVYEGLFIKGDKMKELTKGILKSK